MKLIKELMEAKEKVTVVRREKFQWIDDNRNETNVVVGERSNGKFFVVVSNQNGYNMSPANVMFNVMHKEGTAKRSKAFKDAVLNAFKAKKDVLVALKKVTNLDGWKKVK